MSRFKEIWYGLLFGIGAVAIDLLMHSMAEGEPHDSEWFNPTMLFYRVLFLGLGLTVGWLMWRSAERERKLRALEAEFARYRGSLAPLVTVAYARVQSLLTQVRAEGQARESLESLFRELQSLKGLL